MSKGLLRTREQAIFYLNCSENLLVLISYWKYRFFDHQSSIIDRILLKILLPINPEGHKLSFDIDIESRYIIMYSY